MKNQNKTRQQLIAENEELRRRLSELEQVEKELATSKAVLQAAIDSLPFDFGALGLDGRYMLQNAASKVNWGDSIGKRPEEVCKNEHDVAIWQENHRRAMAGEKLEGDVELTIRGEKRFCHHVTVPIWDDGCIRGVLGVNMDMTEARRAQEALQKARDELERRVKDRTAELSAANEQLRIFRMFAEASSQGVAMADLDGFITYMNPALCRMAGVANPQDAVGKHLTAFCPEGQVLEREMEMRCALIQSGRWEGELFASTDGNATHVLQSSFLIKDEDGNPSRLAAVVTDITEQKRSEEALRASEERFRSYFEQGLIGMAVSSSDKRWIEVNDRLCEILGYSRAELLGMKWTDLTHGDDLESSVEPQEQLLAGEIEHYTMDKRFLRKDGRVVHAAMFVRCFRRTDGTVDHILALIEDTTERRKAQHALEWERQSLWRMLQASDHERQIISYEIHDGLAQYLAAARMQFQAYEAFRQDAPDKARKAYETAIELVCQAHSEARRLISDVRPPVIDENGLETALSHLVHEHRQRGRLKIEFHSNVQFGRLPVILENSLYRIGQESLTNACKHSQSKKVKVTLAQEGQDVRLEVQDWGTGFDPQSVEKGHFGLEGIRQRVRLLGGRLTIDSTLGAGTRIQAVVPILEKQSH